MIFTTKLIWPDSRRQIHARRMFTAPATLPDDPPTLQLILRAALAEIERLQTATRRPARATGSAAARNNSTTTTLQQGEEDLEQSVAEQKAGLDAAAAAAEAPTPEPMPRLPRRAPNRRSAIAVRCRRICRGSRSSSTSTTRLVPAVAARCTSSAKTARRCWITCRLSSGCG